MPEWFFIDPNTDELKTNVDPMGYSFMRKSGIPIMPMLSNNYDREFRPEAIGRILHDPVKRRNMINRVVNECVKNKFVGVNIDFEDLNESSDEYLIRFVKEMSLACHEAG